MTGGSRLLWATRPSASRASAAMKSEPVTQTRSSGPLAARASRSAVAVSLAVAAGDGVRGKPTSRQDRRGDCRGRILELVRPEEGNAQAIVAPGARPATGADCGGDGESGQPEILHRAAGAVFSPRRAGYPTRCGSRADDRTAPGPGQVPRLTDLFSAAYSTRHNRIFRRGTVLRARMHGAQGGSRSKSGAVAQL